MKFLALLVALLILVGGVWYFLTHETTPAVVTTVTERESGSEIEVVKTDVAQAGGVLPVGFPSDIPVETNNLTESFRASYKEKGITQYTVSYTSLKSRDSLWDAYSSYLKSAGYTVSTGSSKSLGQISGTKGKNSLSVVVSNHDGLSLAQINYIER